MQRSPAFPAAVLAIYTLLTACSVAEIFDLQWVHIVPTYMIGSVAVTLAAVLVYTGMRFVSGFRLHQGTPFLRRQVPVRHLLGDMTWVSLSMPLIAVPLFFSAYTTVKSALPFFVDYSWDDWLAQIEWFGQPSWQWLHAIVPPGEWMVYVYSVAWPLVMLFFLGWAGCRGNYRVFTAFFLTWTFGGLFLAAIFASKGPMHEVPSPEAIYMTQFYLLESMGSHYVLKGGGVSAMPSMHLATCVLICVYARRTWVFWPVVLFTLLMWFLSVHVGFHYASDGIAAAVVAMVCWKCAPYLNARLVFPAPQVFAWCRERLLLVPGRE